MEEMGGKIEVNRLQNVALARAYTPLSNAQMAALEAKTESVASQSLFFRHYDRA
jgi:hypothetical protein